MLPTVTSGPNAVLTGPLASGNHPAREHCRLDAKQRRAAGSNFWGCGSTRRLKMPIKQIWNRLAARSRTARSR